MKSSQLITALVMLLLSPCPVSSHSWVEQLRLIAPNGTFVGEPGYPRGNILRTDPGFNDPAMTYILPPNTRPIDSGISPSDRMCASTQQTRNQTEGSPRLKAQAGAAIALRYQENGHVTLPDAQPGKPPNRGNVYVYGTTDPRANETLLAIHKKWNADGTGGDGRGILLSRQNFDDGQCYQINNDAISTGRQAKFPHEADQLMGADMWCQQDIALPQNAPTGKPYTLYWVWDWPTAAEVDPGLPKGKKELYTTCIDIDIIAKSEFAGTVKASSFKDGYVKDQSLNNAAVHSQVLQLDNAILIPGTSAEASPSQGKGSALPTATSLPPLKPFGTGCSSPTSTASGLPAIISLPPSSDSGFRTLYTPSPTTAPSVSVAPRNMPRFRFRRGGVQFPQIHSSDPQNDAPKEGEQELVKRGPDTPDHDVEPPTYKSPRIPIRRRY